MLVLALAMLLCCVEASKKVFRDMVLASDMSLNTFLDGLQSTEDISQSELGSVFKAANDHQQALILRHGTAPKFVDAIVRRPWTDWYPHLAAEALDWSVQHDASLLMDTLKKSDILTDIPAEVLDKSETFVVVHNSAALKSNDCK